MADAKIGVKRPVPSEFSGRSGTPDQTTPAPIVGQWYVNLGTGHSVTVDRALVRSIEHAAQLFASFQPLLQGGIAPRLTKSLPEILVKLEELEHLFNPRRNEALANDLCAEYESFPLEVANTDRDSLVRLGGSVERVIAEKHLRTAALGFNIDRVRATVPPEYPKFELLCELAEHGATIFVPETFVPTTEKPESRSSLARLQRVFRYHAHKLWKSGKAVVIKWTDIPGGERARMHFSFAHATDKPDDVRGRFLVDPSNAPEGSCVLNTPEAKALSDAKYGVIRNPTISDIYSGMFEFCAAKGLTMAECRIWKEDISGAFPQFRWSSSSAMLMALMIDPEYVLFSINGNFGHHSSPGIWDILANAILWVCRSILVCLMGILFAYVDDYMGFAAAAAAASDQAKFRKVAEGLLGPGCINASKSVNPTMRADLLGWDTRLDTSMSGPNQKGRDKLLHCFLRVDTDFPQSKEMWMVLASIAERYSAGLVMMRAFVSPLHHMVQLFGAASNKRVTKRATSAARFCVELWRAVALLLFVDSEAMLVPMRHMSQLPRPSCGYSLIADAGPDRIGAGIRNTSGQLVAHTSVRLPFERDILAKYHNLREFLGLLVNLMLFYKWLRQGDPAVRESLRGDEISVLWNSDSTAAISWVDKMKCNSRCGQHASFALTWFQLQIGVRVTECTHISGDEMIASSVDSLSRNRPTPELDPRRFIDIEGSDGVLDTLRLCDPSLDQNLVDHHAAFVSIMTALARI